MKQRTFTILLLLSPICLLACAEDGGTGPAAQSQTSPASQTQNGPILAGSAGNGSGSPVTCVAPCTISYKDETRIPFCVCPDAGAPSDAYRAVITVTPGNPEPTPIPAPVDAPVAMPDASPPDSQTLPPDAKLMAPDSAKPDAYLAPQAPDAAIPEEPCVPESVPTPTPDAAPKPDLAPDTLLKSDCGCRAKPDAYVPPVIAIVPDALPADAYVPNVKLDTMPLDTMPDTLTPDTLPPDAYIQPDTLTPDTQPDTMEPDAVACSQPDTAPVCDAETDPWWNWKSINLAVKQSSVCSHSMDISWQFDGCFPHGIKVVWSKNPNPTYPATNGGHVQYVSNASVKTAKVSVDDGTGTYYVRMCLYDGGCVRQTGPNGEDWTYSPQVEIKMDF